MRQEITWLVNERLKGRIEEQRRLKRQLTDLSDKIEKLELRFVNDEIPKGLFEKYESKFKQEKKELERKTNDTSFESSNLEKVIDKGLKIAENVSQLWLNRDFDDKQQLQQLIFPEGILYNKEKDRVRTVRENELFQPIPQLVRFLEGKEKSHPFKDGSKSRLVVPTGIEPVKYAKSSGFRIKNFTYANTNLL